MVSKHGPRVVVIDDHTRDGKHLAGVVRRAGYGVRTFSRASDYIAHPDMLAADCLLADLRRPDVDGFAIQREITTHAGTTQIVFVARSTHVASAVSAIKNGASDVLEKPFDRDLLLRAVGVAVARSSEMRRTNQALAPIWRAVSTLTRREAEVCALVASGRLNKQIAAAIGTTERTVKAHRSRAYRKLEIGSSAELVRLLDVALSSVDRWRVRDAKERVVERPYTLDFIARQFLGAPRDRPGG